MQKVSLLSKTNLLEESLCKIKKEISDMKLKDINKVPKSPKEMTLEEFNADILRRRELSELFMKQKSIENEIATLNKKY